MTGTRSTDDELRSRLIVLSNAVPTQMARPTAAMSPATSRETSRRSVGMTRPITRSLVRPSTAWSLGILAVVVASAFWVGRANPPATPGVGQIGFAVDGDFELTITTNRTMYRETEVIEATASLVYRGSADQIQIFDSGHPIGFGIEQVGGTLAIEPGGRLPCRTQTLTRGKPMAVPFLKSGAFPAEDPDIRFKAAYFANPQLQLPAGNWRIYAVASFSEGQCGGTEHSIEAGVTVEVQPGTSSSPSDAPSASPAASDLAAFPSVCSSIRQMSADRCAFLAAVAVDKSGVPWERLGSIQFFDESDPTCPNIGGCLGGGASPTWTPGQVIRIRVTAADGSFADHVVDCTRRPDSLGGINRLCVDLWPFAGVQSPIAAGYHDTPCSGEGPIGCATQLPSIAPDAAGSAAPLLIEALDIAIDHAGPYEVLLGEASLPNGILTAADIGLTSSPTDPLVSSAGYRLLIRSLDGGPPFDNYYQHGWRPGVERVEVTLSFTVLLFEPGAVVQLEGVDVH